MKRQKQIVTRVIVAEEQNNMYFDEETNEIVNKKDRVFSNSQPVRRGMKFLKTTDSREVTYICRMDIEDFFDKSQRSLYVDGNELEEEQ